MIAYAKTADEIIGVVVTDVFRPFVAALFAVVLVIFLWGVVEFLAASDNETARMDGKRHMMWGVIGLVIMVGVNGILWILINFVRNIQ